MRPPAIGLPLAVALVALGGAVGSALRATVAVILPGNPLGATLAVNVVGAFLLGFVLEWLAAPGEHSGERRRTGVRLLLGTGVCGGFTTYSAVTEQAAELLRDGSAGIAATYALGTLLLGALATLAGVGTAALVTSRTGDRRADSAAVDGTVERSADSPAAPGSTEDSDSADGSKGSSR